MMIVEVFYCQIIDFQHHEAIRNVPLRNPLLWLHKVQYFVCV